jgi:predicted transcriptional regulator
MAREMSFREMVEALERKYGSLNAASREAKIPTGTLFSIKRGADPRWTTIVKICHGLEMTLPEAYAAYASQDTDSTRDKRSAA